MAVLGQGATVRVDGRSDHVLSPTWSRIRGRSILRAGGRRPPAAARGDRRPAAARWARAPCYEAASVAEARARAHANGPCDLAILDLGLPDGSGLDLVTRAARRWAGTGWSCWRRRTTRTRCARRSRRGAGVPAQVGLAGRRDRRRQAVLDGGVYADPTVAPLLATGTRVPGTDNTPRELSAREVEVLQLVADGQSNKEIGEALSLSALTVKSHLVPHRAQARHRRPRRRWSRSPCGPGSSADPQPPTPSECGRQPGRPCPQPAEPLERRPAGRCAGSAFGARWPTRRHGAAPLAPADGLPVVATPRRCGAVARSPRAPARSPSTPNGHPASATRSAPTWSSCAAPAPAPR